MINVKNLNKIYGHGDATVRALKGIDLEVKKGEFTAIMGRSGSGKSTLLRLIGLLDAPTSGQIYIDDTDVSKLSDSQKTRLRIEKLGFVFQEYSLIDEMTLLENVCLPAMCLNRYRSNDYRKRAVDLLSVVGLKDRLHHYPHETSGGELQRVTIARALINRPRILFADEPTASLDVTSAKIVLELFSSLNREMGQTIVMVTHEIEDRNYVDRVIWLKDGIVDAEHPSTGWETELKIIDSNRWLEQTTSQSN